MSEPSPTLLIRADASVRMGTGHVMRCLALAQGWQRVGGQVVFAMACDTPAIQQRLRDEGVRVVTLDGTAGATTDADQTAKLAKDMQATWVVADGYQFGADYQRWLKNAGLRLLVIDDYGHATHYAADLVLNQNLHASTERYAHREPYTRLLLGTRYVLLREQFIKWRDWERVIPDVARKVLVTMGGSDPDNVTGKVIETLRTLDMEVRIVVGGSNPNLPQLQSAVALAPKMQIATNATNMPECMAWADMAVTAGGTTCLELAFMGVPSLAVVTAENQFEAVTALDAGSVVLNLGTSESLSIANLRESVVSLAGAPRRRSALSRCGRKACDGFGAARVVVNLDGRRVWLRNATLDDARLLWNWANDPSVRAVSFRPEPIPWESHQQWLLGRLADHNVRLCVAVNADDKPVGYIRFEIAERTAVVSIGIASECRGMGLGLEILRQGCRLVFADKQADRIHAFIKPDNTASLRLFAQAGFIASGLTEIHRQPAQKWIYNRSQS